jgi:ankyrin repeat protein
MARDRGFDSIADLLDEFATDPTRQTYSGDNGEIHYNRSAEEERFQKAVNDNQLETAALILKEHPSFARDNSFFWGEGILSMPANNGDVKMLELLLSYGAKVPPISKWGRVYYFKHYRIAKFLIENGMDADHMTWHRVTLLHDMAQEGDLDKARLLIDHGADLDAIDEEYHSTPLGMAARWGNEAMVKLLLKSGSDTSRSGATWSTPLAWARSRESQNIEALLIAAGTTPV